MDLTRTKLGDWNVTWNSVALGSVDKVTPDLKLITKPIKVGTLGDIVVGERIIGLDGTVKVELREIDNTQLAALTPWQVSGQAIPMIPTGYHVDLYSYAQLLTLHPTWATDTKTDLNFTKAVPRIINPGEKDGVKDDIIIVEFSFYPDRGSSGLAATPPVVTYGTIGTAP